MYDVAVVGAGPAGVAAAIQLKRTGIEPLLLEKERVGGLILNANRVENYPGILRGIRGNALGKIFEYQLELAEIKLENKFVKKIFYERNCFRIVTPNNELYARYVILCSGTLPKKLKLENEGTLINRKLFYEIKYLPKNVSRFVVIGSGDAAFDYALSLSPRAKEINIIFRSARPKCIPALEKEVLKKKNIKIHPKTLLVRVKELDKGVLLKCKKAGRLMELRCDYILAAIGRKQNLQILDKKILRRLKEGKEFPKLFFAGDVKHSAYRQVGIAVGDGLLAAMKVAKLLRSDRKWK